MHAIEPSAGGGITNLLYKLQGPPAEAAILVRIYGKDTDVLIDRERDNALFDELARCVDVAERMQFHGLSLEDFLVLTL